MIVKIYALCCPHSQTVKYIGQTMMSLNRRLNQHINSKNDATKKSVWIRGLVNEGSKPTIILITSVQQNLASFYEKKYIQLYGADNLLNSNVGGGGIRRKKSRNKVYIHEFIEFLKINEYSNSSVRNYRNVITKFIAFVYDTGRSPRELNADHCQNFIDSSINRNTRNLNLTALRLFYSSVVNQSNKLKLIKYDYS